VAVVLLTFPVLAGPGAPGLAGRAANLPLTKTPSPAFCGGRRFFLARGRSGGLELAKVFRNPPSGDRFGGGTEGIQKSQYYSRPFLVYYAAGVRSGKVRPKTWCHGRADPSALFLWRPECLPVLFGVGIQKARATHTLRRCSGSSATAPPAVPCKVSHYDYAPTRRSGGAPSKRPIRVAAPRVRTLCRRS